MHLSVARLCLDCQEVHQDDRCPTCTSQAFGFITRWVKIDPPPLRIATYEKKEGATSKVDTYRRILNPRPQRSTAAGWLRKGGLVIAAGYLARWSWRIAAHRTEAQAASTTEAGDRQSGG